MNCESLPFNRQPLRYNQIVFTTIKIIYNGMNKSARESGCWILFNSTFNLMSKLEAILLALCKSPIIALYFFLTGVFDVQYTGSFFILLYPWVVILLSLWIISVSRSLVGSNSKVNFIFWWYEFNALKSLSVSFFFLLT